MSGSGGRSTDKPWGYSFSQFLIQFPLILGCAAYGISSQQCSELLNEYAVAESLAITDGIGGCSCEL
jgi:hypothetical protein